MAHTGGHERLLAVGKEPLNSLPALVNMDEIPVLSLKEALKPVWNDIGSLEAKLARANDKHRHSRHFGLTRDEAAAISLYTMTGEDYQESVSGKLNQWLRSENRKHHQPWSKYLKLLLSALHKLPSVTWTVHCAAKGILADRYHDECTWWGFNSCSSTIEPLKHFLESSAFSTLFFIRSISGKNISEFNDASGYDEILFLPGTRFRVKKSKRELESIQILHLEETVVADHASIPPPVVTPGSDVSLVQREKTSTRHPACQFRSNKPWFDRRFHSHSTKTIMQPHELQPFIRFPPSSSHSPSSSHRHHQILDRIQGSIIGLALGDALGAHVEFRPRQYLLEHPVTDLQSGGTWGLQRGQFTDDTSMAVCLGISLVCRADFHPYDQLVRYKWWYRDGYMSSTGQCFDIGAATSDSLQEFERRQKILADRHALPLDQIDFLSSTDLLQEFDVECSRPDVAGNGALMRLAPVALFFYRYPMHGVRYCGLSGVITHGDRKAEDACRYYGGLMIAALHGASKEELVSDRFYDDHRSWFDERELVDEIMKIARGSYKKKARGYDDGIRGKGYIVDALEAALWSFWSTKSFEEGVLAAVNLGDDTDTTGAIYGQLAGAYYGYGRLPERWVNEVYAKEYLLCLSAWIEYEGERWDPNKSLYPLVNTKEVSLPIIINSVDRSSTKTVTYDKTDSSASSAHIEISIEIPKTMRDGLNESVDFEILLRLIFE